MGTFVQGKAYISSGVALVVVLIVHENVSSFSSALGEDFLSQEPAIYFSSGWLHVLWGMATNGLHLKTRGR